MGWNRNQRNFEAQTNKRRLTNMAKTVTIPTTADLPADWKTTLFGILTAIGTLLYQYIQVGAVSWQVAAACVLVAIVFYYLPVKASAPDKINIAEQVEKVVADLFAKQSSAVVFSDAEALAASVTKTVLATLSVQQAASPEAAAPLNSVASGQPLQSLAPVTENAAQGNLGAASAIS